MHQYLLFHTFFLILNLKTSNRHHHFKFDNSTEHMYMCFASVLLLNFFSKLTNLSWMRRNTNVNFVIKFSVMEKAEIGMRRFVYFSLFLSRVNVLREFFFLLYIFSFLFQLTTFLFHFKPYIKIYIISFTVT